MNDILAALTALESDPTLKELGTNLQKFNIFKAIGMVSQEIRHSHFLAFLLNPSENHGLGDTFLKQLLMKTLSETDNISRSVAVETIDLSGALVKTEWEHIDISIVDKTSKLVVAIENKVNSGEHGDQLIHYVQVIQNKYPDTQYRQLFIFLTPYNIPPSDNRYLPLTYETLADVIDDIRRTSELRLGIEVLILLEHYTTMLRRHIVTNSDIDELCNKIWSQHRQALDMLIERRPESRLREPIAGFLKELIRTSDLFVEDVCTNTYIRFVPKTWEAIQLLSKGSGWTTSGRILLFQFDNTANDLQLTLYIGPGPDKIRESLLGVAEKNKSILKGMRTHAQIWKYIYNIKILEHNAIINAVELDSLKPQIIQAWENFIAVDFPTISRIIEHEIPWTELEAQLKTNDQ